MITHRIPVSVKKAQDEYLDTKDYRRLYKKEKVVRYARKQNDRIRYENTSFFRYTDYGFYADFRKAGSNAQLFYRCGGSAGHNRVVRSLSVLRYFICSVFFLLPTDFSFESAGVSLCGFFRYRNTRFYRAADYSLYAAGDGN